MIIKGCSVQNSNFLILSNSVVQNKELSWKEKGLLAYLLSLGENWSIKQEYLYNYTDFDGKESTQNAIKKLQQKGYLKIEKVRDVKTGRFEGFEYHVYQEPQAEEPGSRVSRLPVNPPAGEDGNRSIYNNNKIPMEKEPINKTTKNTPSKFEQLTLFPESDISQNNSEETAENIFNHYCLIFKGLYKPRKLPDYLNKIKQRLKNYSENDLKAAINKIRLDKWNIGEHPGNKTFYATIDFLFKNDSQIDRYLNAKTEKNYNDMTEQQFISVLKNDFEDYDYGRAYYALQNGGKPTDNKQIYAYHEKSFKKKL